MLSPKKLYRLLREHPDVSTPEGRSRDRYRRAALTSTASFCSRFLNIVVAFATIPIVSEYLGGDLFGIWVILTNFISILVFADLGIGLGFQNQLIKCYAEGDRKTPSAWISNALVLMMTLCAVVVSVAIWLFPYLPFDHWIQCKDPDTVRWLNPSAQALVISFAIGLPGALFRYIGGAYQRGYWTQLFWMIGRLTGLAGTLAMALLHQPLPFLIAAYIAPPYIMEVLGLFILWRLRSFFRPDFSKLSYGKMRSLLCIGGGFLVTRIAHAISNQGPTLLVAWAFSATEAGYVGVATKVLQVSSIVVTPLLSSVYTALGEAVHKGDWNWVRRVLRQMFVLTGISYTLIITLVVILGNPFLSFLVRRPVNLPLDIFLVLSLFVLCEAFRLVPAMVMNSVSHLRYQVIYRAIFTVTPFLAAWYIQYHYAPRVSVVLFAFVLAGAVPTCIATAIDFHYYKKAQTNVK